jgi:hypothetical protein
MKQHFFLNLQNHIGLVIFIPFRQSILILSRVLVTIDGVWIGE